jgi:hypothetical protein
MVDRRDDEPEPKENLQVWFPLSIKRKLRDWAYRTGRSMTEFVVHATVDALDAEDAGKEQER